MKKEEGKIHFEPYDKVSRYVEGEWKDLKEELLKVGFTKEQADLLHEIFKAFTHR